MAGFLKPSVEAMMEWEYEDQAIVAGLTSLHSSRLEHYEFLEQKRDQIITDINKYLQPFTATMNSDCMRPGNPGRV